MNRYAIVFSLLSIVLGFGVLHGQESAVLIDLPPQTWYEVPNSRMRAICPTEPSGILQGGCDCLCVIDDWSGGVYDPNHEKMILWGGGHNDYYGNEVYAFDIRSLKWELLTQPSVPSSPGNCAEVLSDGRPNTRHTYGGLAYITHADRLFAHGGSLACEQGSSSQKTWTFDVNTRQWFDMKPSGVVSTWDLLDEYSVYDPVSGDVFLFWHTQLFRYDYDLNSWSQLDDSELFWSAMGVAIDSKRGLLVEVGNNREENGNGFVRVRDIRGGDFTPQIWNTTGGDPLVNSYAPGLAYDPVADRILGWNGGSVYALNMDTRNWEEISAAGAPSKTNSGIFGRFRYLPNYNVFIAVTSVDENVHFYKNTPGGNDSVNGPGITIEDVAVEEGDSGTRQVVFNVSLSADSGKTVTVDYATVDGSARAGEDYQAESGTLMFSPGILANSITVPVFGDTVAEGEETFFITLTNVTNAALWDSQAKCTILNDDVAAVNGRLVAAYAFNEGAGDKAWDASGNSNDGSVSGATWTSEGRFGDALSFDGNNDFVSVNDAGSLDLSSALTLEAWIYPRDTNNYKVIVSKSSGGTLSNYYLAILNGELEFGFLTGDWHTHTTTGVNLPTNTWSYVAATYDDVTNAVQIFLDGSQVYSGTEVDALAVNNAPLKIGVGSAGEEFAGIIDEVRIYDRALRESEIQIDMNTAIDITTPVHLTSMSARVENGHIVVSWSTTGSTSRFRGFEVERKEGKSNFEVIGFVPRRDGPGQTLHYSFTDNSIETSHQYVYRLKQMDLDGYFSYSKELTVVFEPPEEIRLLENYPNPFNPATTISFELSLKTKVTLSIFDITGSVVKTLIANEVREPGRYSISFDGSRLPSGVYLYQLRAGGNVVVSRKMLLIK